MKNIVLMPVRNEAWIIKETLQSISMWADHIIIADQQSTDDTREIVRNFSKAIVIDNTATGHSNAVRWLLLDEARKITPHARIWCIDADEQIPHSAIERIIKISENHPTNTGFSLNWMQVWKNPQTIRTDWPWKKNNKACMWVDDGTVSYSKDIVVHDHTTRIPCANIVHIDESLFHLQFLGWQRSQTKQIWYQMRELDAGIKSAFRINRAYIVSKDGPWVRTNQISHHDTEGIYFPDQNQYMRDDAERRSEIQTLIAKRGILFFEKLDIWHDKALREQFKQNLGFYPSRHIMEKTIFTSELLIRNILT